MALALVVVTFTVVSTLLGLLNPTVNTALLPSVTVGLLIVTVGTAVASVIVPVPTALVLAVFVLVTVPFNVNVSVPSLMLSGVVGTVTVTLVCPAGMVIVCVVVV